MSPSRHARAPSPHEDRRPATLILPGKDSGGFLSVPCGADEWIIEVSRSHAWLLQVMAAARESDRDVPPQARGWMPAQDLCEAIRRRFSDAFLESKHTIRHYVSAIKAKLQKKAGRPLLPSELPIESKGGLGYRIWARGLVVKIGRPAAREDGESASSAP